MLPSQCSPLPRTRCGGGHRCRSGCVKLGSADCPRATISGRHCLPSWVYRNNRFEGCSSEWSVYEWCVVDADESKPWEERWEKCTAGCVDPLPPNSPPTPPPPLPPGGLGRARDGVKRAWPALVVCAIGMLVGVAGLIHYCWHVPPAADVNGGEGGGGREPWVSFAGEEPTAKLAPGTVKSDMLPADSSSFAHRGGIAPEVIVLSGSNGLQRASGGARQGLPGDEAPDGAYSSPTCSASQRIATMAERVDASGDALVVPTLGASGEAERLSFQSASSGVAD
mmetsp:Transcript_22402/g.70050  ORF Transcript_22402/g.70050 Transcript_22402/m.70050 type:complete len:281 (-) Transcript_22402:114-956(-)